MLAILRGKYEMQLDVQRQQHSSLLTDVSNEIKISVHQEHVKANHRVLSAIEEVEKRNAEERARLLQAHREQEQQYKKEVLSLREREEKATSSFRERICRLETMCKKAKTDRIADKDQFSKLAKKDADCISDLKKEVKRYTLTSSKNVDSLCICVNICVLQSHTEARKNT